MKQTQLSIQPSVDPNVEKDSARLAAGFTLSDQCNSSMKCPSSAAHPVELFRCRTGKNRDKLFWRCRGCDKLVGRDDELNADGSQKRKRAAPTDDAIVAYGQGVNWSEVADKVARIDSAVERIATSHHEYGVLVDYRDYCRLFPDCKLNACFHRWSLGVQLFPCVCNKPPSADANERVKFEHSARIALLGDFSEYRGDYPDCKSNLCFARWLLGRDEPCFCPAAQAPGPGTPDEHHAPSTDAYGANVL